MSGQTVSYILKKLRADLDVQDHTLFLTTYPTSWIGSEAVTVLSRQNGISRVAAVELGQMLLDADHFKSATGDNKFEDSTALYHFQSDLPRRSAFDLSSITSALDWLWSANEDSLKTALQQACARNDAHQVRHILDQNKMLVNDTLTDEGWTPMHFAAKCGAIDVLTLLIDLGADVNVNSANVPEIGDECTPLMVASIHGKLAVVSLLCEEYGADVLITNDHGVTAMQLALQTNHKLVYKYLTRLLEFSPTRPRLSDPFPNGSPFPPPQASQSPPPRATGLFTSASVPVESLSPHLARKKSKQALAFAFDFDDDEKIADAGYDTPNEFSQSKSEVLETIIASQEQELQQLRNLLHERNREADALANRVDNLDQELAHVRAVSVSGNIVVADLELGIDYYDDDIDSDLDLM